MLGKFLGVGGTDGTTARPFRTDKKGNMGISLNGYLPVFDVNEVWMKTLNPSAVFTKNGFIHVGKVDGEIIKYDANGNEVWAYLGNFRKVSCLFVDGNENIYVGTDAREYFKLDRYGALVWTNVFTAEQTPANGVNCLFQKDGFVYYGHKYLIGSPHVIKVDATTGKVVCYVTIPNSTGGWEIFDLAVDDNQNIYPVTRLTSFQKLSQSAINTGVVNTNGTAVTRVSGTAFGTGTAGQYIFIDGKRYTIAAVTDGDNLSLTASAGVTSGVGYAQGAFTTLWTCVAHGDRIRQIELGLNGDFFTGSNDNKVRKFNQTGKTGSWGSGTFLWSYDLHTDDVIALALDRKGDVYSGSLDNTVKKIDGATGVEVFTFNKHTDDITGLSATDQHLHTISNDGTLRKITKDQQFAGYRGQ